MGHSGVLQRLHHGNVSVMKLDIFAHKGNCDFCPGMLPGVNHGPPVREIGLGAGKVQAFAGHLGQLLLLHHQGNLIEHLHVQVLQYMIGGNVAEKGDFVLDCLIEGLLGAADQDVRLDSHALQILYTGLGGLGLEFTGSFQIGNEGYMDNAGISRACIVLKLTDSLQEGLAFDVAYRAADLDDGDLRLFLIIIAVKAALDLVGDVGDHLNRAAAEVAPALLLENAPVDFSRGHIGVLRQAFINEALIVAQIQVRLSAVVGDEYLSVLDRIHGAGVNVDVGVKFLHGYLVASRLQQAAQGCGCDAFSKAGDNAAGNEYVFDWHNGDLLSVV